MICNTRGKYTYTETLAAGEAAYKFGCISTDSDSAPATPTSSTTTSTTTFAQDLKVQTAVALMSLVSLVYA